MAKSVSQRVQEWRSRQHGARIDVMLSYPARAALYRLAESQGRTLRATLEQVLLDADAAEQAKLDPVESTDYSHAGWHRMRHTDQHRAG